MDFLTSSISGKVITLATNKYGSNVIDTLISRIDAVRLLKAVMNEICLKDNIVTLIRDRYGNHVILRAVDILNSSPEGKRLAAAVWKHIKTFKGVPREQRIVEAVLRIFPDAHQKFVV